LGKAKIENPSEVLRRELEVEPEPATVKLYERVLAGASEAVITSALDSEPVPVAAPVIENTPARVQHRKQSTRFWYIPTAIFLVLLGALAAYRSIRLTAPVKFVAIMPLTTAADSPELGYVADGITESVINNLSRLRQIRVMARSTVYSYRDKGLNAMAAAEEMKVHAVLTGTISKRGDNVLLAAELVGVPEGTRLWENHY
jgi:TolB-like protein